MMKLLPFGILVIAGAANAQITQDMQQSIQQARSRYESCVIESAQNEFANQGQRAMAVEQAFQACTVEESALRQIVALVGPDPVQNEALITGLKLRLKSHIVSTIQRN